MALLSNEDFAVWYLRTSYLNNIKDGVGERLISVNSSVLNTPAFRTAGWFHGSDIKRSYSPPIPTTSSNIQGGILPSVQRVISNDGDEDEEGGMVTGRAGNDTVGPAAATKRRRKREHVDDDDSSDLSDESDDADGPQRAAQQIRFAKMPTRTRADSSPIRNSVIKVSPEVSVTSSASKRSVTGRARGSSLSTVEAVKARARRDTTTSSDMSSENEVDPLTFHRRQVGARVTRQPTFLTERVKEDDRLQRQDEHDDSDIDSVGSAISSEFGATVDSTSLLGTVADEGMTTSSASNSNFSTSMSRVPTNASTGSSPKRSRTGPLLPELPPPKVVGAVGPKARSLLSEALNSQREQPRNPIQPFASLSGKGAPNPFWIKIYAPFSSKPHSPIEMPLDRYSKDGENVTVAEAIGLSLWRYIEEAYNPALESEQLNVNKWMLRMVEDGEVEYDFPALTRTRPMSDFAQNNLRGARGRSRERPYDEFALVPANAQETEANHRATPQYTPKAEVAIDRSPAPGTPVEVNPPRPAPPARPHTGIRQQAALGGGPFSTALNNTSLTPADKPTTQTSFATPRLGTTKNLRIRYLDIDVSAQTMTMEISSDSYIAEVLDHVCKRWNLDKAGFVLKVAGTNTLAPLDRTIEALGGRSDLDLVRRRFGAGPLSLTGSPGSSSPNAPLLLDIEGPSKKSKKPGRMLHPLAQQQDLVSTAGNFKKYNVSRKQLKSFAQANNRILAFDGDYLHVMPAETGRNVFDSSNKTTSIPFGDIIRCKVSTKHHKLVRLVVRRPNESKRYDFEAKSAAEALEIVDEITKEMQLTHT